ncbi:LOW QUALITY PROTEIN: uncharacterized protein ACNLHF_001944 [Anomaloglossus baeobatrachus]
MNTFDKPTEDLECKKANRTSALSTVNFLSCVECHGLVEYNCIRLTRCAPEFDACLTIVIRTRHGSKEYTEKIQRCGLSSECSSAGIITTGHKTIAKNTSCCFSYSCDSEIPTLPSENNVTNGIICESCYYKTYGSCTGQDYIACTGNATQCISYTKEKKDAFFTSREVFHGCGPRHCSSGNYTKVYEYSTSKETVIALNVEHVAQVRKHQLTVMVDSFPTQFFVRRQCSNFENCQQSGQISSPTHKMIFSTSCCSKDNCKTPIPALPKENVTVNGFFCPVDASFLTTNNHTRYAVKCTGDENFCFTFESGSSKQKEYVSGCASISYCHVKFLIGELYRNRPHPIPPKILCKKANRTNSLPVDHMLICKQCQGSIDRQCEQYTRCSPENDACLTIITQAKYGESKVTQLIKRCGFSSECNSAGSISSAQKMISRNNTCCYFPNCVSPLPALPVENTEDNGYICESCYIKDEGSCPRRDYIACTGGATQCISYTEIVKEGTFTSREVLHGCAHPSICDSGNVSVPFGEQTIEETKVCGIPARSSRHPPNILCLYLMYIPLLTRI